LRGLGNVYPQARVFNAANGETRKSLVRKNTQYAESRAPQDFGRGSTDLVNQKRGE